MTSPSRDLLVLYFDGRHARPVQGLLRWNAQSLTLHETQEPNALIAQWTHGQVQWPERTRHGLPTAHLQGGGSLQAVDGAVWNAWQAEFVAADLLVVRLQQSWRGVAASLVAVVLCLFVLWHWGLPWGSQAVLSVTPLSVDRAAGEIALRAIDEQWMRPSELPADQQATLRKAFNQLVRESLGAQAPAHELLFRKSKIGPNAFALPGGSMVMTDEMVELVDNDEAVLLGVLAHELGHVQHRHGMRMLIQGSAVGLIAGLVWGDASSLLAMVPIVLGQASYSRDAERQADQFAADVLVAAGRPPSAMVRLFERLEESKQKEHGGDNPWSAVGIAFSSHPADEERIRFFKDADARLIKRR
jgi:Zn-dependent protease with chaperone function